MSCHNHIYAVKVPLRIQNKKPHTVKCAACSKVASVTFCEEETRKRVDDLFYKK